MYLHELYVKNTKQTHYVVYTLGYFTVCSVFKYENMDDTRVVRSGFYCFVTTALLCNVIQFDVLIVIFIKTQQPLY